MQRVPDTDDQEKCLSPDDFQRLQDLRTDHDEYYDVEYSGEKFLATCLALGEHQFVLNVSPASFFQGSRVLPNGILILFHKDMLVDNWDNSATFSDVLAFLNGYKKVSDEKKKTWWF